MAAKKIQPTPEQRKLIEQLTAFGLTHVEMRQLLKRQFNLSISHGVFLKVFRQELDEGTVVANTIAAGKLFEQVKAGNTTAIIFWLKTRARWRETQHHEVTGKDGAPIQHAEVSLEQYRRAREQVLDEY